MLTIKEAKKASLDSFVQIKCLVSKVEKALKRDGVSEYALISVQDSTDTMTFPMWNDYESVKEGLYELTGSVGSYNGSFQIREPGLVEIFDDEFKKKLIPSYNVHPDLLEYYYDKLFELPVGYKELVKLAIGIGYNNVQWEKFLNCPGSVMHHHNKISGLFIHVVGVMKNAEDIIDTYSSGVGPFRKIKEYISKDRIMVKAMLHDICKIDDYDFELAIKYKEKETSLQHIFSGAHKVLAINEKHDLISQEDAENIAYGILCHHGEYGSYKIKTLEDHIVHLADMIDAKVADFVEDAGEVEEIEEIEAEEVEEKIQTISEDDKNE